MAEKLTGDGSNAISSPKIDTFRPGTYPNNAVEATQQCNAVNVTDLTRQGYSNVGGPWLQQYHSTNQYNHILPPNGLSCMFPPGRIATTANSQHIGGVQLLMCDGSVRFISENLDVNTWRNLGSIDGGEVLGDTSWQQGEKLVSFEIVTNAETSDGLKPAHSREAEV